MKCFLRMGNDSLDEAVRCPSLKYAKGEFMATALELDRYGQRIDASIHIATDADEVVEYPDLVLSLGPRGGLKCERA